jgi:hypothetical protein
MKTCWVQNKSIPIRCAPHCLQGCTPLIHVPDRKLFGVRGNLRVSHLQVIHTLGSSMVKKILDHILKVAPY